MQLGKSGNELWFGRRNRKVMDRDGRGEGIVDSRQCDQSRNYYRRYCIALNSHTAIEMVEGNQKEGTVGELGLLL
jgi:hypothetical protein